jgi:6-phosphofructokinase 1
MTVVMFPLQEVTKAVNEKNWGLAVMLRGKSFQRNLSIYRVLTGLRPPTQSEQATGWSLAIMHIGARCCGMNAYTSSLLVDLLTDFQYLD